jgi:hypothetical protein
MDDDKLTLGGIIVLGVLTTSLVMTSETPTSATMLEPEFNIQPESSHEIVLEDYPDYLKKDYLFSFQYDQVKISLDSHEDEPTEIELIEIPVSKRMVFQFKKPVKLEFS